MGTKNNPGAYDCYANAEPDEPMFILLGRDRTASLLVMMWTLLRMRLGDEANKEKIAEAGECSRAMAEWAAARGKDVDGAVREFENLIIELGQEYSDFRSRVE